MAVIRVDFDELMQFGRTYIVMSDSLTTHSRALNFNASKLDQMIQSFGLELTTGNSHLRGKSVAGAAGDAEARARRVAKYLKENGKTLYRHAGDVGYEDNRFDWFGMLRDVVTPGVINTLVFIGDRTLVRIAETGVVQNAFNAVFAGASVVKIIPGVFSLVLGAATVIDRSIDLIFDVDGWLESFSDVLGIISGVGASIIGASVVFGIAITGPISVPVIASIAAAAAFGSYLIDNREAVGETLMSAWDGVTGFAGNVWDAGTDLVEDALTWTTEHGIAATRTTTEALLALDDIRFVTDYGGVPLSDVGILDDFAGTDFGPLSVIGAGTAAVEVPTTLGAIGESWDEGDAFGVVRDFTDLVDQGGTIASPFAPAVGPVVSLSAKSFGGGMDIGDWIDGRTGISDFLADRIYSSPIGRLFD